MSLYIKKDNDLVIDPYCTIPLAGYKPVSLDILEKLFHHAEVGNKVNQKRNLSYCKICESKVRYIGSDDLISDYMVTLKNQDEDGFYLVPSLVFHTALVHDVFFPEGLIKAIEMI